MQVEILNAVVDSCPMSSTSGEKLMISCSCNQSVIIGAHAAPSLDFCIGVV
jgi:hypothetical protein